MKSVDNLIARSGAAPIEQRLTHECTGLVELADERTLERVGVGSRFSESDEYEHVGSVNEADVECLHGDGCLLVANERFVERTRSASGEDIAQEIDGRTISRASWRNTVGDVDGRCRSVRILNYLATLGADDWTDSEARTGRHRWATRNP